MIATIIAGVTFGVCVGLVLAYGGLFGRILDLERSHADLALDFMHHEAWHCPDKLEPATSEEAADETT